MKKLFIFLMFATLSFSASAQGVATSSFKFGFLSMSEALKSMPNYVIAQKNLSDLKAKYDAETKRSEDEFNKKYEEFLDGQREFAPTILQKRQAELQNMMDKNVAFKKESQRLLQQAENDALAPLKAKLASALSAIGTSKGYAFILNTDNESAPFINTAMGENISELVKAECSK